MAGCIFNEVWQFLNKSSFSCLLCLNVHRGVFQPLLYLSDELQHFVLNLVVGRKLARSHIPLFIGLCSDIISRLLPSLHFTPFPSLFLFSWGLWVQSQPVLRILHQPAAVSSQAAHRLHRGHKRVCLCIPIVRIAMHSMCLCCFFCLCLHIFSHVVIIPRESGKKDKQQSCT